MKEITLKSIIKFIVIFISFLFVIPSLLVIGWYLHILYLRKTKTKPITQTIEETDKEEKALIEI